MQSHNLNVNNRNVIAITLITQPLQMKTSLEHSDYAISKAHLTIQKEWKMSKNTHSLNQHGEVIYISYREAFTILTNKFSLVRSYTIFSPFVTNIYLFSLLH